MNGEDQGILALIVVAVIILIIYIYIRRMTESQVLKTVKNLENSEEFQLKIKDIQKEIESNSKLELNKRKNAYEEYLIENSIERSKSVSKGKIIEHFAPFLIGDWIKPSETIFSGSPIDLISFRGINDDGPVKIEFIEIKTGASNMNKKQKLIKDAIQKHRVFYKQVKLKE